MSPPNLRLILVIIICVSVALSFSTTIPKRDKEACLGYHFRMIDTLREGDFRIGEPPIIFILLNTLMVLFTPIQAYAIIIIVPYILGIITIYLLAKHLSHDERVAIFASIQYGVSILLLMLFAYGYSKQLLALALTPLAILYFHKSLHTHKHTEMLLSGIIFGIIGLTHEISFVSLLTFYLVFLGIKIGVCRRLPLLTIRNLIIIIIPAIMICGSFYVTEVGAIVHAGGEGSSEYLVFIAFNMCFLIGLISFALVGLLNIKYHKHLIYSMLLSGLLLMMGWVAYQDRFLIQLIIPLSIISGYGFTYLLNHSKDMNTIIGFILLLDVLLITLSCFQIVPVIHSGFDILILPIILISQVFIGWFAVVLKFILGIPFTIMMWVIVVNYLYYKLYKRVKGEEHE